jgi:hypothetical protein
MRWQLLVFLLLVSTAAAEDATPRTYTSRRVENIKRPLGGTSHYRNGDVSVKLALRATGALDLVAKGTGSDRFYTPTSTSLAFDITAKASWTTTWIGTWAERKGERVLELELASDRCTKNEIAEDGIARPEPCVAASKRATVVCKRERVRAAVPETQNTRDHAAWRCSVTQGSLGSTPVPWVVGNTQCLASTIDANGAMSFVEC